MGLNSIFVQLSIILILSISSVSVKGGESQLKLDYYASTCPAVFDIVRKQTECAVASDPGNAARIVRLHFHDCFVQGCDGSVLLDDTITLKGEKEASTNRHSLKGYEIIDQIKNVVESECPGIVSCADILTIAARDAVILVGGPYWHVPVGRKDSITASYELAETNIPLPSNGLFAIIAKFLYQGLSVTDMVALSGAHTIGVARCANVRERIYGDYRATAGVNPLSESYLSELKSICPVLGRDDNTTAMDHVTPYIFDNSYYHVLLSGEAVLNSDQELYSSVFSVQTRDLVKKYAHDPVIFFQHFSDAMVKMGNIVNQESFVTGQVRTNCRFVNT